MLLLAHTQMYILPTEYVRLTILTAWVVTCLEGWWGASGWRAEAGAGGLGALLDGGQAAYPLFPALLWSKFQKSVPRHIYYISHQKSYV